MVELSQDGFKQKTRNTPSIGRAILMHIGPCRGRSDQVYGEVKTFNFVGKSLEW